MKTKLLYFILSMFFLAEQSTFCAEITVTNSIGDPIYIGQKEIAIKATLKIDIPGPFNINFKTNNNNYVCEKIPTQKDTRYTVNQVNDNFNVNSDKKINNINQWACKKLPLKFKVKNSIPNTTAYVWLGADEFKNIGTGKNVDINPKSVDTKQFGIHIDINNNTQQKIKGDDIKINNNDEYVIIQDGDKVKVKSKGGQSTDCYFVGDVTVKNESDGKLYINSIEIGEKNTSHTFKINKELQNFDARLIKDLKQYALEKVPALFNITKYVIQKDQEKYIIKAGNKTFKLNPK